MNSTIIEISLLFIIGICLGSFGNNVISAFIQKRRLDLNRSLCFCAEKKLKLIDIVPLLSYLLLKGKCSYCNEKIGLRFFLVELSTGLLAIYMFLRYGYSFISLINFFVFYIMLLISVIDFKKYIIPNKLLAILLFSAIILLTLDSQDIFLKLSTSIVILLLLIFTNFIYKKNKNIIAIGFGDIKYIGILTIIFSFPLSLFSIWLASLIAIPTFYLLRTFNEKFASTNKLPFGTFISVGFFLTELGEQYLATFFNFILNQNEF